MKKLVLIAEDDLLALVATGDDMARIIREEWGEFSPSAEAWELNRRPTTWREVIRRPSPIVEVNLWRGV